MKPGPPLRKECPYCKTVKELINLASGNTFGGMHWSDTKNVYPMLPHNSDVQKCPGCGKYYFLEDAETLPSEREILTHIKWVDKLRTRELNLGDLYD